MRYLGILLLLVPALPLAAQEPLVVQVKGAIDKGVQYLKRTQRPNGGWENAIDVVPGGQSSLAVLALLTSGVEAKDPAAKKGLDYVRKIKSDSTYIRSLIVIALAEAKLPEDRGLIKDHVDWLIKARSMEGDKLLGWGYTGTNKAPDGSNTQYAVLGLWAAKQAGAEIQPEVWESIRKHYIGLQDKKNGSWRYVEGALIGNLAGASITMTTAGVSGLLISGMELNEGREGFVGPVDPAKNCGEYMENPALDQGFSWINKTFTIQLKNRTFYHLYGLERAGRLSGMRFFGEFDWYREGAKEVVKWQKADGSWFLDDSTWDRWSIVSTSMSLLFLSKGRTPVLMSKLVHGEWSPQFGGRRPNDTDWNNDRNDLRHLVAHASNELFKKQPLAWQTIDLMHAAQPPRGRDSLNDADFQALTSDLLQSPILYITGHRSPEFRFTAVEKKLLKLYIESGGFIIAEACCGSVEFDQGFKALVRELWPDQDFLPLAAEHPIWTFPNVVKPGDPYKLHGLNQGCKTVLIYSPQDLSCRWETGKPEDGRCVQAFRLGLNLIAYATGMQPPQPRLTQIPVAPNTKDAANLPRGYFKAVQLKHGGDWQPAPRAMRNLMEHLNSFAGVDVALKTDVKTLYDPDLINCKFMYMHGRGKFVFDNELKVLRENLENGGLLFADACCGKDEFDKSFRELAVALFPKGKLEQVPRDDDLYRAERVGEPLTEQTIRCRLDAGKEFRSMPPFLEGIKHEGRWVILYSKYDIGCALENHQSLDCRGYDPASAKKIARAVALYAVSP